jgi:hypothetical protein
VFRRTREQLEKRLDGLERAVEGIATALQRLAEKPKEGSIEGSLLESFGGVLKSLAEATATSQAHTSAVLDKLVDKAAKRALPPDTSISSAEAGRRSVEVRRAKAEAAKNGLNGELPEWAMGCNECKAILFRRPAENTDDLIRHAKEMHVAKLAGLGVHVQQ